MTGAQVAATVPVHFHDQNHQTASVTLPWRSRSPQPYEWRGRVSRRQRNGRTDRYHRYLFLDREYDIIFPFATFLFFFFIFFNLKKQLVFFYCSLFLFIFL